MPQELLQKSCDVGLCCEYQYVPSQWAKMHGHFFCSKTSTKFFNAHTTDTHKWNIRASSTWIRHTSRHYLRTFSYKRYEYTYVMVNKFEFNTNTYTSKYRWEFDMYVFPFGCCLISSDAKRLWIGPSLRFGLRCGCPAMPNCWRWGLKRY